MAGGHSGSWPGFFRVFAVFAALMLLLAQGAQELVPPTSGAWQVLSVYEGLTRWSIPALFLLWGMSTLEGGGRGGLSGALLGRVLPAFCMLVFWGAAYAVAAHLLGGGALSWSGIGSALLSAARGDTYFHLWPLYPLVGLYLIQPLLARFTASASRNEVLYLLGLSFLMASLLPLWAAFHPNHALVVLLDRFQIHAVLGWVGYYLAGWYLYERTYPGVFDLPSGDPWRGPHPGGPQAYRRRAGAVVQLYRPRRGLHRRGAVRPVPLCPGSQRGALPPQRECVFGIYLIHQLWVLVFRWFGVSPLAFGAALSVPVFAGIYFLLSLPFAWLIARIPGVGRWLTG